MKGTPEARAWLGKPAMKSGVKPPRIDRAKKTGNLKASLSTHSLHTVSEIEIPALLPLTGG